MLAVLETNAIWAGRPAHVPWAEWPFHAANPHRLPLAARRLLGLVGRLARECGWSFASAEYLAGRLATECQSKATWKGKAGFHAAYVRKLLRRLVSCGLLEWTRGRGGGLYRPAPPPAEAAPPPPPRKKPPRRPCGGARDDAAPAQRQIPLSALPVTLQGVYRRATALLDEFGRLWSQRPERRASPANSALEEELFGLVRTLDAWLINHPGYICGNPWSFISAPADG